MKFGYARGDADDPDLARQLGALKEAGCTTVFQDEEFGVEMALASRDRCLAMLQPGDTLVVFRLDRLALRLRGLAALLDDFQRRGIGLISLSEAIDTGTRAGRAAHRTIGVLAAMDHAVAAGRILAGKQAAWERTAVPDGGRRPGMTREQLAQARGLFEEGKGLTEIGRIMGVAEGTVRSTLARAGVEVKRGRGSKSIMTPEMLARARGLHAEGMSVPEIGQVMGLRPALILKTFRRAGVTVIRRRRGKITPEMLVRARDLIGQGSTPAEAAKAIGVTHRTLRATFRREGIKARLRSGPKVKVSPEKLVRARELIAQGKTQAEAAKAIGVGLWSLRSAFAREGAVVEDRRPRATLTPARLARARRLLDHGKSQTAAANIIGVRRATLSNALREEAARDKTMRGKR